MSTPGRIERGFLNHAPYARRSIFGTFFGLSTTSMDAHQTTKTYPVLAREYHSPFEQLISPPTHSSRLIPFQCIGNMVNVEIVARSKIRQSSRQLKYYTSIFK